MAWCGVAWYHVTSVVWCVMVWCGICIGVTSQHVHVPAKRNTKIYYNVICTYGCIHCHVKLNYHRGWWQYDYLRTCLAGTP